MNYVKVHYKDSDGDLDSFELQIEFDPDKLNEVRDHIKQFLSNKETINRLTCGNYLRSKGYNVKQIWYSMEIYPR